MPPALPPRRRKAARSAVAGRGVAEPTRKPRTDWAAVRRVAVLQKALIGCVAAYCGLALWQFFGPGLPPLLAGGLFAGTVAVALVCTAPLAWTLFGPTEAVCVAAAVLLPGVGLLALGVTVHTARLWLERENVAVGAFGADLSRLR